MNSVHVTTSITLCFHEWEGKSRDAIYQKYDEHAGDRLIPLDGLNALH